MFSTTTRSALVMTVVAMLLIPLAASWFAYPTTHLPPGFGVFPPQFVAEPPGFNLIVFIAVALLEAAFAAFLIFPQWFGFKPPAPSPRPALLALPWWFWVGGSCHSVFLVVDVDAHDTVW